MITRRHSLGLIGAALLSPGCSAKAVNPVRIGSKSSSENVTIAEIYAVALERENVAVGRHMNLGNAASLMAAVQRGDIDLYPEYVRTGVENPYEISPASKSAVYDAVRPLYERRYGVTWLAPSPVNYSPCLVTSQYAAEEYWLLSLTKCADIADQLRLAATSEFLASGGMLDGLQRLYGGFNFKKGLTFDPGAQHDALSRGDADVANGFTTESKIVEKQLAVLRDDKRFWPQCNVAPVIRLATLHSQPRVRFVLNRISRALTEYAVQQMNMRLDLLYMDAHDMAEDFVDKHAFSAPEHGR